MKKYNSHNIESLYNNPIGLRFRNNRLSIDRSNLRVIEAREETSNAENNIEVSCLSQKVNEDLLKNYNDDLDEISDSPLVDDADDLENISDGSLVADSDVEDGTGSPIISLESKVEVPIGYRSCLAKRLKKYKKLAFFKPKLYNFSQHRVVVGCVHINDTNSQNISVKNEDFLSNNENQGDEPNVTMDVATSEAKEVIKSFEAKEPEPVRGKLLIQEELDESNEVILGLGFLVEIWDEPDVSLRNYLCLLCDEELEKNKVLNHLIDIPHRLAYLDKHFPKFTSMFYKNTSLENSEEKIPIAMICKIVNDGDPALPFITSYTYLSSHRHKLEKEINNVICNKDDIAILLKELCLIVETKQNQFNDDPIDVSCCETVVSECMADSHNSENNKITILSDKENSSVVEEEKIIDLKTDEINPSVIESTDKSDSDPIGLHKRQPKRHFLGYNYRKQCHHNRHYRFSGHKGSRSNKSSTASLQTNKSIGVSTSSSKSRNASVPVSTLETKLSAMQSGTTTTSSKPSLNFDTKSEHENKEKTSSHCGKCNGLKRSFRTNSKRYIKRCDCKRDSSAIGHEIKQKEDSSKANLFHKSELSQSVTSSSSGEKQISEKNILSTKTRYSDDLGGYKLHRSELGHSRYKWQKGDRVIRNVEKSEDKMSGEYTVRSKNEKDLPLVRPQPKNQGKSNDDKGCYASSRRCSRSPKRSSRLPSKKLDVKSPGNENRDSSHSVMRKVKTSPLRQNSGTTVSLTRRRSRSPLRSSTSIRRRQLSQDKAHAVIRKRSRSPFRSSWRRSRSPLSIRKRSRTPPNVKHNRSRSPFTSVRSGRHITSPPRRTIPLSSRNIRSRQLSPRRRSRSPVRWTFKGSISPPNRRWRRSNSPPSLAKRRSRSPLRKHTSSISSKEDSPFEKQFINTFQTVGGSFHENLQLPVPPVNSQSFPPESYPASWNVPNPAGNYNYNFSYPPTNLTYLQTTYPQYTGPTYIPPYPNTAYPPPVTQPAPALPVSASQYVPPPLPTISVSAGMPSQVINSDVSVPLQYLNVDTMPTGGLPNEKIFHELRSVVTKLFGNDARLPSEAESRDILHKGLSAHERVFDRNTHSDDIPFLGSAGTSNASQSQKPSEEQERMYIETLQQLRAEFESFSIPDEIFKLALKGMFPEQLLNDRAFDIVNQKSLEQGQSLSKSPKHPNMNAKVEFKESSYVPKQGNIFPIVKQNPVFCNESFTNSNTSGASGNSNLHANKPRNTSDIDFRVKSDYPKQDNGSDAQPEKISLAQRLASVLVKLQMFDVPRPLLSEMLHRIGVFNRSLPLQDITEEEIISILRQHGYLQCK